VLDKRLRTAFGYSGAVYLNSLTAGGSNREVLESVPMSGDHCRLDRLSKLPVLPRECLEYALWKSVSESSVVMVLAADGSTGINGATGDIGLPPFKDVIEGTLRAKCLSSDSSDSTPVGVLFPGSDGIVGMCRGTVLGEAVSSSDWRVRLLLPVCTEEVVPLRFLGGLCMNLLPFVGRGRKCVPSERSASLSWLST
jgi:hypothetical protein